MTELYLVRHGQTDWNFARRIQGRTDVPLNDTGREQARATGRLLARRSWDALYASPLSRAFETAELIAAELGLGAPVALPGLIERDYGDAEGLDFAEVERRFPDGIEVPGRESRDEVAARVAPALLELAVRHAGESVLVVSHGGAIRAALAVAEPGVKHGMITNGSVHSFRVDAGALRLIAFDDPLEHDSEGPATDSIEVQNAVEAHDPEAPRAELSGSERR